MTTPSPSLGALLHAFLADELPLQKGLRPTSIKAHRDALRLFLTFVATDARCRLTQITLDTLTLERVLRFLQHLEDTRHNHRRTRNHRLMILHTFFEFLGRRVPECLAVAQQVSAIPRKRVPPLKRAFSIGTRSRRSSVSCRPRDVSSFAIARSY
jgi:site-specific recombinase XerD